MPPICLELKGELDQAGLDGLVRHHLPMVLSTCMSITRNRHDAEDAAQAAFLRLSLQLRREQPIRDVGAWLHQVACRTSFDLVRRRNRVRLREAACPENAFPSADQPEPVDELGVDELRGRILVALDELPPRYRIPLILHYFGGISYEQLARELHCSRGALRVRMCRSHKMLQDVCKRQGIDLGAGVACVLLAAAVRCKVSESLVASTTTLTAHAVTWGTAGCTLPADAVAVAVASNALGCSARIKVLVLVAAGVAALSSSTPLWARLLEEIPHLSIRRLLPIPTLTSPIPRLSAVAPAPSSPAMGPVAPVSQPSAPPPAILGVLPPAPQPPTPMNSRGALPSLKLADRPTVAFAPAREMPVATSSAPSVMKSGCSSVPPIAHSTTLRPATLSDAVAYPASRSMRRGFVRPSVATSGHPGSHPSSPTPFVPTTPADSTSSVDVPGAKSPGVPSMPAPRVITEVTTIAVASASAWQASSASNSHPGSAILSPSDSMSVVSDAFYMSYSGVPGMSVILPYGAADAVNSVSLPVRRQLDNNGQVISRSPNTICDYSHYDSVTNSIDNPVNGVNGWFAATGGKVILPTLHVAAGTHAYNWGESESDRTLDLINGVSLNTINARKDCDLKLTLLAAEGPAGTAGAGDFPAFPAGHHLISIWQAEGTSDITGGIDLATRYDTTRIAFDHLDESALKFWYFQDGWHRVTDSSLFIDSTDKIIGGHVPSGISYFAVSTPEPTTGVLLLAAGGLLLRRRRNAK